MTTTITAADLQIPTGTWTLEKGHTHIGFVARHLMVTKVRGNFTEFDGRIEVAPNLLDSTVEVTLASASITTGTADRDGHLRSPDFLDVENYPELRFVSTGLEKAGDSWVLRGDLTIKDVTKPIELEVDFEGIATDPWGNTRLGFTANTELDRETWGLTWNVPLEQGGFLVSKTVKLEIETQLVRA